MIRYLAGIVIIVILFVVGILPKLRNNDQLQQEAKAVSSEVPEVTVASPRLATPDPLILPGDVQAISETAVQARTSGYVSKLYVDIGSHVKAGQVLADVQSPDVDQQVTEAYADTAKSRATVGQSQADVSRLQAGVLQSRADITRQKAAIVQAQASLDGAKSRKAEAQAGVSQAKAKLLQSQHEVAVQKAALTQAQAQYDLANANVKRYATLLSQGFVSQQDYDQAEATFKTNAAIVESAQASISASQADVTAAEETVHSDQALVQASQSDQDAAAANVNAARAVLQSSYANLTAAQSSVEASQKTVQANQAGVGSSEANARRFEVLRGFEHLVAPFDGIITARNVDVGSLVSPGANITATANSSTPNVGLFGIAKTDTVRVFVNLPQSNYQWVKNGTKTKVLIRELPKQTFTGTIFQTAGALNDSTRTLLTEIHLPNPTGVLLPGMYAQVIIAGDGHQALRIPSGTIVSDSKGTRVLVIDAQSHVHYTDVTLGRDYGTEVEVLSGIKQTDRLVATPSDQIGDGEAVDVVAGSAAK